VRESERGGERVRVREEEGEGRERETVVDV